MDVDYNKLCLGFAIAITSIISILIFIYGSGILADIFGTITTILAFLLIRASVT